MQKQVTDIQNRMWKAYKDCLSHKDFRRLDDDLHLVINEFKKDRDLYDFSVCLGIAYEGVLRKMIGGGNNVV